MKIEQIIYLTDIAQTHSMTQSAQRLFISQQALSFSIKKLEEEFGATLLSRSNHGVELTEEGKRFLQQAGSMVTLYQQIKADFLTESAGLKGEQPAGELRIFCHTRLLEPLLVDLLEHYTKRYPQVSITLKEQENMETLEAISQDKGDVGLIFLPDIFWQTDWQPPDNLQLEQLFSDEFIVCCSSTHPLNNGDPLSLDDLTHIPVVLFDTNPRMSGGSVPGAGQNLYYSNNMSFHKAMLRRSLAVSVITSFEFRKLYFKHKDMTALPLTDHLKSVITLATNTQKPLSIAAQLFIRLLKKYDFYGL